MTVGNDATHDGVDAERFFSVADADGCVPGPLNLVLDLLRLVHAHLKFGQVRHEFARCRAAKVGVVDVRQNVFLRQSHLEASLAGSLGECRDGVGSGSQFRYLRHALDLRLAQVTLNEHFGQQPRLLYELYLLILGF